MVLGARNDNQLKYALNIGPVTLEAQYSPSEGGPFSTTLGRSIGGMAKYAAGPIGVSGAYLSRKDDAGREGEAYVAGVGYQSGPLYLNASYARSTFDDGLNTALLLVGLGVDNAITGASAAGFPRQRRDQPYRLHGRHPPPLLSEALSRNKRI